MRVHLQIGGGLRERVIHRSVGARRCLPTLEDPTHVLSLLVHAWAAQAKLSTCRGIKAASTALENSKLELKEEELRDAWEKRDLAYAFRVARSIAGAGKISLRRWAKMPLTAIPTSQQWLDKLSQPATSGGWGAVECDTEIVNQLEPDLTGIPILHSHSSFATDLMKRLRRRAVKAGNRRGVPHGEIPSELWRVTLNPQRLPQPMRHGPGYVPKFAGAEPVVEKFKHLCAIIGSTARLPLQLNISVVFHMPKQVVSHMDSSAICEGSRTIHCYGSLPKIALASMWDMGYDLPGPHYAFGAIKSRRREEAITV